MFYIQRMQHDATMYASSSTHVTKLVHTHQVLLLNASRRGPSSSTGGGGIDSAALNLCTTKHNEASQCLSDTSVMHGCGSHPCPLVLTPLPLCLLAVKRRIRTLSLEELIE